MNTFKFWAVFSVGVAAGAAVALICAPQSGEKTRKQLRRKLEDAGEYVKDTAGDLGEKATKAYKKGKDAVADYSDELGDKAAQAYKQGREAVSGYTADLGDNLQSAVKSAKSSF